MIRKAFFHGIVLTAALLCAAALLVACANKPDGGDAEKTDGTEHGGTLDDGTSAGADESTGDVSGTPATSGSSTPSTGAPATETPTTDAPSPDTGSSGCSHTFGDWKVTKDADCGSDGVRSRTCSRCGTVENESFSAVASLDEKRVMFAGNSMLYYGEVVINSNGSPTTKKGNFARLAEKFGDNVTVTNLTYGSAGFFDGRNKASDDGLPAGTSNYGLYQLMTGLHPNYYNNPQGKAMDDFYRQDWVIFQQRGAHVSDTYNQLKKLAALFPPETKFAVMITHYDIAEKGNNLAALKKVKNDGWLVLPWGEMVSDLWNNKVSGMGYKYKRADFVNTKDNQHPNFLTGYIETLMTYCALTGNTAVGADYSFVSKDLKYYPAGESSTQFVKVLNDPAEMVRIQELIDRRLAEIGNPQTGAAHKFGDWCEVSAASCASAGKRERTCTVCGKVESISVTVLHTFGEWKVTTEATASAPGVKTRTCTVCGAEETKKYTSNLLSGKTVDSGSWFGIKRINDSASGTDGIKTYDPNSKYMDVALSFTKAEVNKYTTLAKKYLPNGQLDAAGKYLCGFWYKLDSTEKVASFKLYNTATLMDIEGFDILVSKDGKNWTVVYSAEDLVTDLKYEQVDSNTNMFGASFAPTEANYVMFALTAPRSRNATATAGFNAKYGKSVSGPNDNPHFFRIVEFEVFAED